MKGIYAFPLTSETLASQSGMTLRDYFAAKALNARGRYTFPLDEEAADEEARLCYQIADAMLRQREVQP
jgi:hypothetical protein